MRAGERKPFLLWDDVPEGLRRHGAFRGLNAPWRGCRAAVQWGGEDGYRRCSVAPLPDQLADFCTKHGQRAGLLPAPPPRPVSDFPRGLPGHIGNIIRRLELTSVAALRALSDDDIAGLYGVGPVVATQMIAIRDTWSDDEVLDLLGWRARMSPPKREPEPPCAWVGEAAYLRYAPW